MNASLPETSYRHAFLLLFALCCTPSSFSSAMPDSPASDFDLVAEQARSAWDSGGMARALEILEQAIERYPHASTLHKLRGDILTTARRPQDALTAYESALADQPKALEIRWAKWSVLIRSGQESEAIEELHRIVDVDPDNPLAPLRLAQALRKLNRLEESLKWYKRAVALAPHLLGWRLSQARAHFDVLDYPAAEEDIDYVVRHMPAASPLELPAKNLMTQIYGSMERGRRFVPVLTQGANESQLKEWAAIRADSWRLFSAGRYQEAEPVLRRMLALNPKDSTATHQLGLTLMQLGRCKEALAVFGKITDLNPGEEEYADTVFRMGQCHVELEQWEDAYVHFHTLYETAVEFEETNKNVALPSGTRVLSKEKLLKWLEKVRPHIPEAGRLQVESPARPKSLPVEEIGPEMLDRLKPQNALGTSVSLMGRDADFSWFRYVIPANRVMRDDFPTGAHEFIPLESTDTFQTTQPDIYLVFRLVSDSYDAVPLAAQCFLEVQELAGDDRPLVQDRVLMAMSDQSGFFKLIPPGSGWKPGLYRCGLFAGEGTTADTLVDEVRFRVVESSGR